MVSKANWNVAWSNTQTPAISTTWFAWKTISFKIESNHLITQKWNGDVSCFQQIGL